MTRYFKLGENSFVFHDIRTGLLVKKGKVTKMDIPASILKTTPELSAAIRAGHILQINFIDLDGDESIMEIKIKGKGVKMPVETRPVSSETDFTPKKKTSKKKISISEDDEDMEDDDILIPQKK